LVKLILIGLTVLCGPIFASSRAGHHHSLEHRGRSSSRFSEKSRREEARAKVEVVSVSAKDSEELIQGIDKLLRDVYQINAGRTLLSPTN